MYTNIHTVYPSLDLLVFLCQCLLYCIIEMYHMYFIGGFFQSTYNFLYIHLRDFLLLPHPSIGAQDNINTDNNQFVSTLSGWKKP